MIEKQRHTRNLPRPSFLPKLCKEFGKDGWIALTNILEEQLRCKFVSRLACRHKGFNFHFCLHNVFDASGYTVNIRRKLFPETNSKTKHSLRSWFYLSCGVNKNLFNTVWVQKCDDASASLGKDFFLVCFEKVIWIIKVSKNENTTVF